MSETLLELRDLQKYFPVMKGVVFQKPIGWVKAVDGVSYTIRTGETLGLVGESGCGKTTTSKLILLLEKPTGGAIIFRGRDLQALERNDLKTYRRGVQAVFQDPFSSLNPRIRVGDIIAEPVLVNEALPKAQIRERVQELLRLVG
ncbi:MAG TPA: ATP-binding cassette domain-containing protein, partial [Candidatus Tectomicrobia bacterium]